MRRIGIADPEDSLAWLFAQGGEDPEEATRGNPLSYEGFIKDIGAIVMGSTTYQWVLAHEQGRWPYEQLPAWVMTSRDLAAPEKGSRHHWFADQDICCSHRILAAQTQEGAEPCRRLSISS